MNYSSPWRMRPRIWPALMLGPLCCFCCCSAQPAADQPASPKPPDAGIPDAGVSAPDEGASDPAGEDEVVRLETAGGALVIDRFEASRSDATRENSGVLAGPARSRTDVLPWVGASLSEAEQACQAAGARLCTLEEFLFACQGEQQRPFPYGFSQASGTCNDYHQGGPLQPGGARAACTTPEGVMDLVGNVAEWVRPKDGSPAVVAGGSYNLSALAVSLKLDRCSATDQIPPEMQRIDVGFRCCQRSLSR